jgi:hypothetical protein
MQNRSTLAARTDHSLAPFIGFQPASKNTTANRLTVAGERERERGGLSIGEPYSRGTASAWTRRPKLMFTQREKRVTICYHIVGSCTGCWVAQNGPVPIT